MNKYTFTRQEVWIASTEVEANSKEEALQLIDDGDVEWDTIDWEYNLNDTLQLVDVDYGCPLTAMVLEYTGEQV